jgi:hypothetical protein
MRSHRHLEPRTTAVAVRLMLVPAVVVSLLAGIAGGLVRAGVTLPWVSGEWVGHAVPGHAFLMICTFMGTLIGIERAVAVKKRLAFAAPLAAGLAGLVYLAGALHAAAWLALAAAVAFVAVNVLVVARQRAPHTALLLMGALAWLAGSSLLVADAASSAVIPWWFSFLVLTIAAERLEMTRLMRRRQGASQALYGVLAAHLLACAISGVSPRWGALLYGASLMGLAAWLLRFDIARRTVSAHGLSRYMAVCLLLGYFWLAVSGVAWCLTSQGMVAARDTALHALSLGFVFSMVLGHAPVILPAIARVKLLFGWAFYVPLAMLHGSLAVRLVSPWLNLDSLATGAAGNALAIALFAATIAGSALAWRVGHSPSTRPHDDAAASP